MCLIHAIKHSEGNYISHIKSEAEFYLWHEGFSCKILSRHGTEPATTQACQSLPPSSPSLDY